MTRIVKSAPFDAHAAEYSVGELEALLTDAGFTDFVYRQALFSDDATPANVRVGHGSSGFVVVRARNS